VGGREEGCVDLDSVFGLQTHVQVDTTKCVEFRKDYIIPQIPPRLLQTVLHFYFL